MPYKDPKDPRKLAKRRIRDAKKRATPEYKASRKQYNISYLKQYFQTERGKEARRKYYAKGTPLERKLYIAEWELKRSFKITLAEKEDMYNQQKGICKLCGEPLPSKWRSANVDHCHVTGRIRGLVHIRCNTFLGWIENWKQYLVPAFEYLGIREEIKQEIIKTT